MSRQTRINRACTVKYRLPWWRRWRCTVSRDISATGVSFVLPHGLCWSGLPVEVEVESPVATFRSSARIARVHRTDNGREVGVEFKSIPEEARARLALYIAVMERRESRDGFAANN